MTQGWKARAIAAHGPPLGANVPQEGKRCPSGASPRSISRIPSGRPVSTKAKSSCERQTQPTRQTAAVALRARVDVRRVQDTAWSTPWMQAHLVTCTREEASLYQADGPAVVLWPQTEGLGVPPDA
jgi:hypothetical protein